MLWEVSWCSDRKRAEGNTGFFTGLCGQSLLQTLAFHSDIFIIFFLLVTSLPIFPGTGLGLLFSKRLVLLEKTALTLPHKFFIKVLFSHAIQEKSAKKPALLETAVRDCSTDTFYHLCACTVRVLTAGPLVLCSWLVAHQFWCSWSVPACVHTLYIKQGLSTESKEKITHLINKGTL